MLKPIAQFVTWLLLTVVNSDDIVFTELNPSEDYKSVSTRHIHVL